MKTTANKTENAGLLIPEQEVMQALFGRLPAFSTMIRLRKEGQLPPHIKVASRYYYRQETVDQWLREQETGKNQ